MPASGWVLLEHALRRRLGDRRRHKRYDVVGYWAATLSSTQTLRIANIGREGALAEALAPLPVHSVYQARLVLAGEESDVRLRVRHVQSLGEPPHQYLIGIEFLDLSPAAAERIDELIQRVEDDPEGGIPKS